MGTVQVQLKCGVTDPELRVAHNATLSVPSTVGRKALSNILQTLLSLPSPLPFQFLIDDQPLRTTLEKYLHRRNQTTEQTLTLLYYLPLPPPTRAPSAHLSRNWLTAIHAASPSLVLAAGYSASPVLLSSDETLPETHSDPHKAAIKAVHWLPHHDSFLTASLDRTVRLWQFTSSPLSAAPIAHFRSDDTQHPCTFASVAVRANTAALGSDNGTIWYLPSLDAATAPTRKRARLPSLPATRLAQLPAPLPITALAWHRDSLITSGWEPLARYWDLDKSVPTVSVPCGGKPVTDMHLSDDKLLLSAVDGAVRVVDPRDGKGVVAACGKRNAHKGVVAAVRWLGEAAVSAGFDGTLRFWDVRAFVQPSRVVSDVHDGGRCLAVDAVRHEHGWCVFSAGEDGKVAKFLM